MKRPIKVSELPPELRQLLHEQRQAFRNKFGRDPDPDDPVFFDPNKETPTAIPKEQFRTEIVEAGARAGISSDKTNQWIDAGFPGIDPNNPENLLCPAKTALTLSAFSQCKIYLTELEPGHNIRVITKKEWSLPASTTKPYPSDEWKISELSTYTSTKELLEVAEEILFGGQLIFHRLLPTALAFIADEDCDECGAHDWSLALRLGRDPGPFVSYNGPIATCNNCQQTTDWLPTYHES